MTEPEPTLVEPVRLRVVQLAADALGRLPTDAVPGSLRRVAGFTPARRARLGGAEIAAALAADGGLRAAVARDVRAQAPVLAGALDAGQLPVAVDPAEAAAFAYLLRPSRWAELVSSAAEAWHERERSSAAGRTPEEAERSAQRLDQAHEDLRAAQGRHREQQASLKAENADLRRKLGEERATARNARRRATEAEEVLETARAARESAAADDDARLRRLRSRLEQLEQENARLRRSDRAARDSGTLRARLLLDTLLEAGRGLQRELAIPAVAGSPADGVAADLAHEGSRGSSAHGSLAPDDPVLLDALLAMPRCHLVVDGYNVTKSHWPDLPLDRQRDRLVSALSPVAARTSAEVTVVFDAAETRERPPVSRPRNVRVLFSPVGVIADDIIRDLVAAEPTGRPVVVVSSDRELAHDVARSGARVVSSAALSRLLAG